jgi:hypothetical protein
MNMPDFPTVAFINKIAELGYTCPAFKQSIYPGLPAFSRFFYGSVPVFPLPRVVPGNTGWIVDIYIGPRLVAQFYIEKGFTDQVGYWNDWAGYITGGPLPRNYPNKWTMI